MTRRFARTLVPSRARRAYSSALARRAASRARAIAHGDREIVAGPWLSEVGFELLYWRPFLMSLVRLGMDPQRVTAISRGGVASWYDGIATRYADAFDTWDRNDFVAARRRRIASSGSEKQFDRRPDERALLASLGIDLGASSWLHPQLLYRLVNPSLLYNSVPTPLVHRPLPGADAPRRTRVAIKVYANAALQDACDSRRFVDDLVSRLSSRVEVEFLATPARLDDHERLTNKPTTSAALRDNLGSQAAIVATSAALVTTAGGFSYLGLYSRVPTVALSTSGPPAEHEPALRSARAAVGGRYVDVPIERSDAARVADRLLREIDSAKLRDP